MKRAVVVGDIGGFGDDYHVGDEAMFEANADLLRSEGWEVLAVSRDPERTSRDYSLVAFPRLPFHACTTRSECESLLGQILSADPSAGASSWPALDALAGADALVISGGGNLNSTWPDLFYERVAFLLSAKKMGKTRMLTGQTLGPHLLSREFELLIEGLEGVGLLGVREGCSRDLANRIATASAGPIPIRAQVDDASFLEPKAPDAVPDWIGEDWIAITLAKSTPLTHQLASGLDRLADETDARLVFLPHAGEPHSDLRLAEELSTTLTNPLDVVPLSPSRESIWWASRASLVVSTRYHPLVFALANGIPALGIFNDDYTRVKIRGALAWWGLESWCIPVELADQVLGHAGSELWERQNELSTHLTSHRPRIREVWDRQRSDILAILRSEEVTLSPSTELPKGPQAQGWWAGLSAMMAGRLEDFQRSVWDYQSMTVMSTRYAKSLKNHLDKSNQYAENLRQHLDEKLQELSNIKNSSREMESEGIQGATGGDAESE